MSIVDPKEIRAGIVIHCAPEALRQHGGCQIRVDPGRETRDDHYFLVLEVYEGDQTCLATPLFSEKNDTRDRILLRNDLKSGKAENWAGQDSYFFKWQFWKIPLDAFRVASLADTSTPLDRRFYADGDALALAEVTRDIGKLRQPWRPWNAN